MEKRIIATDEVVLQFVCVFLSLYSGLSKLYIAI